MGLDRGQKSDRALEWIFKAWTLAEKLKNCPDYDPLARRALHGTIHIIENFWLLNEYLWYSWWPLWISQWISHKLFELNYENWFAPSLVKYFYKSRGCPKFCKKKIQKSGLFDFTFFGARCPHFCISFLQNSGLFKYKSRGEKAALFLFTRNQNG